MKETVPFRMQAAAIAAEAGLVAHGCTAHYFRACDRTLSPTRKAAHTRRRARAAACPSPTRPGAPARAHTQHHTRACAGRTWARATRCRRWGWTCTSTCSSWWGRARALDPPSMLLCLTTADTIFILITAAATSTTTAAAAAVSTRTTTTITTTILLLLKTAAACCLLLAAAAAAAVAAKDCCCCC